MLEKEKAVLKMSPHYQRLSLCFQKWAADSYLFMKGEESLFPDLVHKDEQYFKLIEPSNHLDKSTKQCLEIIFSSFVVVSNHMLKHHLKGGKYANPSEELLNEAKATPT